MVERAVVVFASQGKVCKNGQCIEVVDPPTAAPVAGTCTNPLLDCTQFPAPSCVGDTLVYVSDAKDASCSNQGIPGQLPTCFYKKTMYNCASLNAKCMAGACMSSSTGINVNQWYQQCQLSNLAGGV
jgi:hypothetical protein